jgi:hypothetical protein
MKHNILKPVGVFLLLTAFVACNFQHKIKDETRDKSAPNAELGKEKQDKRMAFAVALRKVRERVMDINAKTAEFKAQTFDYTCKKSKNTGKVIILRQEGLLKKVVYEYTHQEKTGQEAFYYDKGKLLYAYTDKKVLRKGIDSAMQLGVFFLDGGVKYCSKKEASGPSTLLDEILSNTASEATTCSPEMIAEVKKSAREFAALTGEAELSVLFCDKLGSEAIHMLEKAALYKAKALAK